MSTYLRACGIREPNESDSYPYCYMMLYLQFKLGFLVQMRRWCCSSKETSQDYCMLSKLMVWYLLSLPSRSRTIVDSQCTHMLLKFQTYSLPYNKYAWITTHNAYAIDGEVSLLGLAILSPTNQEDTITSQLNVKFFTSKYTRIDIMVDRWSFYFYSVTIFQSLSWCNILCQLDQHIFDEIGRHDCRNVTLSVKCSHTSSRCTSGFLIWYLLAFDILTSCHTQRGVRGLMLDIYEFQGDLWLCHSTGTCFDFTAFVSLQRLR